uniref:peptidoglycan-binding domain-containing protein n=1 Tax=Gracilibacillus oryzae TaxID=1672701 RepID=UPI002B1BD066|nr:peptidoglycan-binding domain-containing protein [Gracilibacillus oryzae]
MPDYYYANPVQVEDDPFAYNESDPGIEDIQLMLEGLDYNPGRLDGYFDEGTKQAVEAFQADNNLEVTGEVDKQTAEVLQTVLTEKVRSGADDAQLEKAIEVLTK